MTDPVDFSELNEAIDEAMRRWVEDERERLALAQEAAEALRHWTDREHARADLEDRRVRGDLR